MLQEIGFKEIATFYFLKKLKISASAQLCDLF